MYSVNDLIIYGSSGVCRVEAIGVPEDIPSAAPERSYYTLRPLFDNGTIRVPTDAKVFMRPVMTRSEADAIIAGIPEMPADNSCISNSPQLLSEHYKSYFTSHRCEDLLTLIKSVYAKNARAGTHGKSIGRTDQHYFQRAKDLVEQELSIALEMPLEEVGPYIAQKVDADAPRS
ncbi:MAG: CarD family transcriptional regulator [Faecalibacterium sp.]|nr:CarD family transcriptional regulator [Faecalibacterium sp.]